MTNMEIHLNKRNNTQRQHDNIQNPQDEQINNESTNNVQVINEQVIEEAQEIALKRFKRNQF